MYGYVIGIINTDKIFYDKKTSVIIIEAEFILKRDYMKQNHHSLAYKRQKQPNKTYKDLKQKQKMKIADQMFRETCSYYKENGEMPTEEAAREITERIYKKLESQAVWVPFDEVYQAYLLKMPRYEIRIREYRRKSPQRRKSLIYQRKRGEATIRYARSAAGK